MADVDSEVVQLVKNGDKRAFSEIVKRYQKALMRVSVRFMKDLDAAEDVVQESFIKAYEKIHSFEGRSSFKSWLFQITINTAKNKLRDRSLDMQDVEDIPLAIAAYAESALVGSAVSKTLHTFVEALPFKQRTALVLRVYEDLSFKEIAEIMECPYDTAKANYRHALMKLKEDLKNNNDLKNWSEEMNGQISYLAQKAVEVNS